MNKKYLSISLIVIASVGWGVISLFSKPLMQMGFSSFQTVFMRSLITVLLLGCYMLIKDKNLFKIKVKDIPIFIGAGGLGFAFCAFCYMLSITENGAGVAVILMYTSPIFTAIIARFVFSEKFNLFKIISLVGVLAGCVMVSLGGELRITLIGAILGILSGVGLALLNTFYKISAGRGYSSFTAQFYTFIVTCVVTLPFSKVYEMPAMIAVDYMSLLYFFLLAFVSTLIPYVLYNVALRTVSASTGGMVSSLEAVVGALTGFIAFNENIGIVGVLGIVIMLASIVLLSLKGEVKQNIIEENTP